MIESGVNEKRQPTYFPNSVRAEEQLEAIASSEGRSVAQVCEAFLRAGTQTFRKRGPSFLQRFLSRQKKDPTE